MREKYTFEDLKDEENLVKFLQKVWVCGVRDGMVNHEKTVDWFIKNEYMPNFKEMVSK